MSTGAWLQRAINVWTRGFAIGVPALIIVTALWQTARLVRRMPASYDVGEFVVYQHATAVWRTGLALTVGMFVYVASMLFVTVFTQLFR